MVGVSVDAMKLFSINIIILPGLLVLSRLTVGEVLTPGINPVNAVTAGSDKFALDFYMQLKNNDDDSNMIMSPIGVQIVLAMVTAGAKGNTLNELDKVMYFPRKLQTLLSGYRRLFAALKAPELKMANSIFVEDTVDLMPKFSTNVAKYFSSAIQKLPFAENPSSAVETINSWAEKNTNGKIRNIVKSDDVKDALVVLANAIHFKANWKEKFDENETQDTKFFTSKSTEVEVRMMSKKKHFRYGHIPQLNSKIIELPYKNDRFRMVIILPDEIEGLSRAERRLQELGIATAMQYLVEQIVEVKIPKFKIESNLNMNGALKKLGLVTLFGGDCDLTGMTNQSVRVKSVKQKAFIEIDEKGTEAAAVTVAIVGMKASPYYVDPSPVPQFIADHPFLYMLMTDDDNNFSSPNVLFIGNVRSFRN